MNAPRTLTLPRLEDLKSNSLEDIKKQFRLLYTEVSRCYGLLWQDVYVRQVDADGWIFFGNKNTNGSWRIGRSGDDYNVERRENDVWVTKSGSTP